MADPGKTHVGFCFSCKVPLSAACVREEGTCIYCGKPVRGPRAPARLEDLEKLKGKITEACERAANHLDGSAKDALLGLARELRAE